LVAFSGCILGHGDVSENDEPAPRGGSLPFVYAACKRENPSSDGPPEPNVRETPAEAR